MYDITPPQPGRGTESEPGTGYRVINASLEDFPTILTTLTQEGLTDDPATEWVMVVDSKQNIRALIEVFSNGDFRLNFGSSPYEEKGPEYQGRSGLNFLISGRVCVVSAIQEDGIIHIDTKRISDREDGAQRSIEPDLVGYKECKDIPDALAYLTVHHLLSDLAEAGRIANLHEDIAMIDECPIEHYDHSQNIGLKVLRTIDATEDYLPLDQVLVLLEYLDSNIPFSTARKFLQAEYYLQLETYDDANNLIERLTATQEAILASAKEGKTNLYENFKRAYETVLSYLELTYGVEKEDVNSTYQERVLRSVFLRNLACQIAAYHMFTGNGTIELPALIEDFEVTNEQILKIPEHCIREAVRMTISGMKSLLPFPANDEVAFPIDPALIRDAMRNRNIAYVTRTRPQGNEGEYCEVRIDTSGVSIKRMTKNPPSVVWKFKVPLGTFQEAPNLANGNIMGVPGHLMADRIMDANPQL